VAATRVGRIVGGSGVQVRDASGKTIALAQEGFDHFSLTP